MPCHHKLEQYLDDYVTAASIAADTDGPLFRTAAGKTGPFTRNRLWQQDAYRMIQQHARAAGIKTRIGNHTFRATGITDYLKNGGKLETAQHMANHDSPRDDEALRPSTRRDFSGRSRKDRDLMPTSHKTQLHSSRGTLRRVALWSSFALPRLLAQVTWGIPTGAKISGDR